MKAKRLSKRFISLLLSLLMVLSMTTIGLISVSSAEVDEAESAAETDTIDNEDFEEDLDEDFEDEFCDDVTDEEDFEA